MFEDWTIERLIDLRETVREQLDAQNTGLLRDRLKLIDKQIEARRIADQNDYDWIEEPFGHFGCPYCAIMQHCSGRQFAEHLKRHKADLEAKLGRRIAWEEMDDVAAWLGEIKSSPNAV